MSFIFSAIITVTAGNLLNSFNEANIVTKIERYANTNESSYISKTLNTNNELFIQNKLEENIWKIEIPKINLIADIKNGTSEDILNKYVGHFEETPENEGNVALAAHNRGYDVNYFGRLKELEIGDEVIYFYNGNKRIYKVDSKTIIKDNEWQKLENTKDNRLTLITCVENQPKLRRCIQAVETK